MFATRIMLEGSPAEIVRPLLLRRQSSEARSCGQRGSKSMERASGLLGNQVGKLKQYPIGWCDSRGTGVRRGWRWRRSIPHPTSSAYDLPAQSPPWPLRCCGLLLGYCSLFGKGIFPGPLGLSSVNLAHSLGNPLSKCQVGFEFNFDGIHIQQSVGNLDLGLLRWRRGSVSATDPEVPEQRQGVALVQVAGPPHCTSSISTTGTTQRTSQPLCDSVDGARPSRPQTRLLSQGCGSGR